VAVAGSPDPVAPADDTTPFSDLVFSPDQESLRREVRRFLENTSPIAAVRHLMETPDGYDAKIWAQMGQELQLQALHIPEEYGGGGFSFVELVVVLEEMGRALFCAPFFSSVCLAANAILAAGTEEQKAELLPGIADGSTIATLAVTEEDGSPDPARMTVTAVPAATGGYRLSGTKSFVLDGHVADLLVVAARTEGTSGADGVGLFAVTTDAEGLTRKALGTMDLTRRQARLRFAGVPARRLGEDDGTGWSALSTALDQAAVCLAAEQVGGTQRCLEMAVEYAKLRVQFGKPIGSFQAIKHKCADMLVWTEASKSAAYSATAAAAAGSPGLAAAASIAQAYCSGAYFRTASENIQIHGGIGFTWEHDAHLYFRRAKSSEVLLGDATYHRERLAGLVLG
jgi:alkylation response protein AidB-like acyl-CoA dehydrogenase